MKSIEYREINIRLDQERKVLLGPDLFQETFRILIAGGPSALGKERIENYPSANFDVIFEKFADANLVEPSSLKKLSRVFPVKLSVDEQRYILDLYKDCGDEAVYYGKQDLAEQAYTNLGRFERRCRISNREAALPPGVLNIKQGENAQGIKGNEDE